MSKKLLAHIVAMQEKATEYITPGGYRDRDGTHSTAVMMRRQGLMTTDELFIGDMLYMLDGPEQREAQADAEFDYIVETEVTASKVFGGENSDADLLARDLQTFIEAAQRLDKHKKVLFRLRGNAEAGLPEPDFSVNGATGDYFGGDMEHLLHGVIGVATEAGELAEIIFDRLFIGKAYEVDMTNVREEIGDVLWYLARLCKFAETDFDTEQRRNIAKLRKRHGERFNAERDRDRNLSAEREVLESGGGFWGGLKDVVTAKVAAATWSVQQQADTTWAVFEGEGFRIGGFPDKEAAETAMRAEIALDTAEPPPPPRRLDTLPD